MGIMTLGSIIWLVGASIALGQQWPRFRGPNGQGISHVKGIPVKWTDADCNWKIALAGTGHCSPVVWDEKVFVTSADEKGARGYIQAFRVSDGEELWRKEYSLASYRMNSLNSYAVATPTVDADRIYVLWPTTSKTMLVALDHDGNEAWNSNFPGANCQHGPGTSPIVYDDVVVFTLEHERSTNNPQSVWIAVEGNSGEQRWRLPRTTSAKTSYSTPCVFEGVGGKASLVFTSFAHGITAVDPAAGTVVWEAPSALVSRVVSSPVIAGDLVIGSCGDGGSGKRLIAIRPNHSEPSSEPAVAYTIEDGAPYVPTSVAYGGFLFTFHDRGQVSCLRISNGERLWSERPAGRFYGSPVWVSGNLYCITTSGDVVVLKASSKYELLGVNPLGEKSNATAAVGAGRMFLRTYSHLTCIGAAD